MGLSLNGSKIQYVIAPMTAFVPAGCFDGGFVAENSDGSQTWFSSFPLWVDVPANPNKDDQDGGDRRDANSSTDRRLPLNHNLRRFPDDAYSTGQWKNTPHGALEPLVAQHVVFDRNLPPKFRCIAVGPLGIRRTDLEGGDQQVVEINLNSLKHVQTEEPCITVTSDESVVELNKLKMQMSRDQLEDRAQLAEIRVERLEKKIQEWKELFNMSQELVGILKTENQNLQKSLTEALKVMQEFQNLTENK